MGACSNNIVNYCFSTNKKLIGIMLSSINGWGIINFQHFIMVKNFVVHFFSSENQKLLSVCVLGFSMGYSRFIKLKGIGYKFLRKKNNLILKFGLSHRVVYSNLKNIYGFLINKATLKFKGRSISNLTNVVNSFKAIRKKNVYKKKGIFIKGGIFSLKISNKKVKF